MRPESRTPNSDRPIGDLIRELYQDFSILVDRQIALAKEEVRATARTAGQAAIGLAAGVLVGLVGFIYLMLACVYALSLVMPAWAAALVVGAVLAVIGAIAAAAGARRLTALTEPLPETRETLREEREWMREIKREVKG